MKELKLNSGLSLTNEEESAKDGSKMNIKPVWKWLLENES
jgi:hypothetical protein